MRKIAILACLASVALGVAVWLGAALAADPGDASCDRHVDSIDAALILQLQAQLVASLACEGKADVNADLRVDSVDAALVLQFDAGLLDQLGPGAATVTPRPTRTPTPEPPTPTMPAANCHPSYVGVCLDPGAEDYDCLGGGGNGPLYVAGPFQVVGDDKFGLDADNDGIGCE